MVTMKRSWLVHHAAVVVVDATTAAVASGLLTFVSYFVSYCSNTKKYAFLVVPNQR